MRFWRRLLVTAVLVSFMATGPLACLGSPQAPGTDIKGGTETSGYDLPSSIVLDLLSQDSSEAIGYLSLPTNATVVGATLTVNPGPEDPTLSGTHSDGHTLYPMMPQLDIGADGTVDWAFEGVGYGRAGLQDVFANGSGQVSLGFPSSATASSWLTDRRPYMTTSLRLPRTAQVDTARLLIEPVIEREWWNISYQKRIPLTIAPDPGTSLGPFHFIKELIIPGSPEELRTMAVTMVTDGKEQQVPFSLLTVIGSKATMGLDIPSIPDGQEARFNIYYSNPDTGPTEPEGRALPILTYFSNEALSDSTPPHSTEFTLSDPHGLHVLPDGTVMVADTGDQRILHIDTHGKVLGQVGVTGQKGTDDTHLDCPHDVTIDGDGRIIVADTCNDRVQVFTSDGRHDGTIGVTGVVGMTNRHLFYPKSVALDPDGRLYVSDMGNRRVQIFQDPDSDTATWTIGETQVSGTDSRHLSVPMGLAVSETVLVTDQQNSRVQVFAGPDDTYADKSLGLNRLSAPSDVAVSKEGIYITDMERDLVLVLDTEGYPRDLIHGLTMPSGIAVGPNNDIWISDTGNDRLVRVIGATLELGQVQGVDLPSAIELRLGDVTVRSWDTMPLAPTIMDDIGPGLMLALQDAPCGIDTYGNEVCAITLTLDGEGFTPGTTIKLTGLDIRYSFQERMSVALAAGTGWKSAIPVKASSKDGGSMVLTDIDLHLDHPPSALDDPPRPLPINEEARHALVADLDQFFMDEGTLEHTVDILPPFEDAAWHIREDGWLTVDLGQCMNTTGTLDIELTAVDVHGQIGGPVTVVVQVLEVPDPPVLVKPPDVTMDRSGRLGLSLEAYDGDGDALEFYLEKGPEAMSVLPNGSLTWVPPADIDGECEVTVGATDGALDATATFTVTISGNNGPPVLQDPGQTTMVAGEASTLGLVANDPEGGPVTITMVRGPPGISLVDGPPRLIWTPHPDQAGTHLIQLSLSDGELETMEIIRVEVLRPAPWVKVTDGPDSVGKGVLSFAGTAGGRSGRAIRVEARIDNGDWTVLEGRSLWSIQVDTRELKPGIHRLELRAFDGSYSGPARMYFPVISTSDLKGAEADLRWTDGPLAPIIFMIVVCVIGGIVLLKRFNGVTYCMHRSPDGPTMCIPLGDSTVHTGVQCEDIDDVPGTDVPRDVRCFLCLGRLKRPEDYVECPRCGRIYHRTCSERLQFCPMCGTTLVGDQR